MGDHIVANESEDPNLFVFITQGGFANPAGRALEGTVCHQNNADIPTYAPSFSPGFGYKKGKGLRLSINSYKVNDKQLALVK